MPRFPVSRARTPWSRLFAACLGALALLLGLAVAPANAVAGSPTVTQPLANTRLGAPIYLAFTIPSSTVDPSSLKILFDGSGTDVELTPTNQSDGSHAYIIMPLNPNFSSDFSSVAPPGGTITDGTYSIRVSYRSGGTEYSTTVDSLFMNVPCSVGSWSVDGLAPCTPATPGHFVAVPSATSESECAAGTFQQNAGSTMCLPVDPGHYSTAGSSNASDCAVGTYQPDSGQGACLPAPKDSYVDTAGATAVLPCPEGTSTAGTGSTSAADCAAPTPETPAIEPISAPVEKAPSGPCAFSVGSKLGLKCVLTLTHLTSMQHSAVSFSVLKPSAKICAVRKGKLVGKRAGVCRVLIKPEVVNSLGKQHKVSLTVS